MPSFRCAQTKYSIFGRTHKLHYICIKQTQFFASNKFYLETQQKDHWAHKLYFVSQRRVRRTSIFQYFSLDQRGWGSIYVGKWDDARDSHRGGFLLFFRSHLHGMIVLCHSFRQNTSQLKQTNNKNLFASDLLSLMFSFNFHNIDKFLVIKDGLQFRCRINYKTRQSIIRCLFVRGVKMEMKIFYATYFHQLAMLKFTS